MKSLQEKIAWIFENGECPETCGYLKSFPATQIDPEDVSCKVLDYWSKKEGRCPHLEIYEKAIETMKNLLSPEALIEENYEVFIPLLVQIAKEEPLKASFEVKNIYERIEQETAEALL